MPAFGACPQRSTVFFLAVALSAACVMGVPTAWAEETKQAQPAETPFDPASLPKDRNERKKAILASLDPILARSNKLIDKFRNEPELKEAEYAELDDLFQALRDSEASYTNGNYVLDVAVSKGVKPILAVDSSFEFFVKRLKKWREVRPQSPTAPALLASLYVQWAWTARGSGFASTVGEKQFELFHDRMREARFYCEEAAKLADNDPTIWYCRVKIAQAINEPKEAVYEILRQSHKAGSYYVRTHEGAAEYFLPRWHGEPGDCEELAAWSKEELGGDLGAEAYGRIALMVNNYDPETIYLGGYSEADLLAVGRRLLERYPQSDRIRNFALLTAYVAQDRELAKKIREGLPGKLDMNVWHYQELERLVDRWLNHSSEVPLAPAAQKWLSVVRTRDVRFSYAGPIVFYRRATLDDILFAYDSRKNAAFPVIGSPFGGETLFLVSNDASRIVVMRFNRRTIQPVDEREYAVLVYQVGAAEEPVELADLPNNLTTPIISADGKLFAVQVPGEGIQVWDTTTGKVKYRPEDISLGRPATADINAGTQGNRALVSTTSRRSEPKQPSESAYQIVDLETGKVIAKANAEDLKQKLNIQGGAVLSFDGDSTFYTHGHRFEGGKATHRCLVAANVVTGEARDVHCWSPTSASGAVVSSDHRVAAISIWEPNQKSATVIRFVDVGTGKQVAELPVPFSDLGNIGFADDSSRFFSTYQGRIYVWEMDELRKKYSPDAAPTGEKE